MPMDVKETKKGVIIDVHVKPSSRRNSISVSDGILIEVKEPPQQNKANIGTIKLMAKALGVPSSSITLVHGSTDNLKSLLIIGLPKMEIERRLLHIVKKCDQES